MLRNLLVPLDGSAASEHALPWALALARSTGAAVHLVHVHEVPAIPATGDGLIPNESAVFAELERLESETLDRISTAWRDDEAQIAVVKALVDPQGSAAATLAGYASGKSIDLTVMTTHGRGPWSRVLFGSVTDEFLRTSPCPTLLLRTGSDQPPAPGQKPKLDKVVVPLDGSTFSERAIEPAVRLFEWFGCEIELLTVIDAVDDIVAFVARVDRPPIPQESSRPVRAIVEAYLQDWAGRLKPVTGRIATRVVEHGDAAEVILKEASQPTVAVAMATHGRSGLSRAVFGSVADQVIRRAQGPVLIVRPNA
jgi:nucleotide-binding universal stress UspA family protein